jgi:hypothetical protein
MVQGDIEMTIEEIVKREFPCNCKPMKDGSHRVDCQSQYQEVLAGCIAFERGSANERIKSAILLERRRCAAVAQNTWNLLRRLGLGDDLVDVSPVSEEIMKGY